MAETKTTRRPSRRLGQNFLKDEAIATRIISSAHLDKRDSVLEPGAGYGILTNLLSHLAGKVIAVEKDPMLASFLRKRFKDRSSVDVIEGDFLKVSLPSFNKVVGTPPYYLSSKLILFLTKSMFEHAFLVLQKEFCERLLAQPGSSRFGRLSVTAQRALIIELMTPIPRTAFHPVPKVDSALLAITMRSNRTALDEAMFEELVRGIFGQRRRLLRSALVHHLENRYGRVRAVATMGKLTIPDLRVFQLSLSDLENLCEKLTSALGEQQAVEVE